MKGIIRGRSFRIFSCVMTLCMIMATSSFDCPAAEEEDVSQSVKTQEMISDLEKQTSQTKKAISLLKGQREVSENAVANLKNQSNSYQNKIDGYSDQLKDLEGKISETEQEMDEVSEQIVSLNAELQDLQKEREERYELLKNRMKVVYVTMLIALSIENFMLAFCRQPWLWCLGQVVGWGLVPVMSANYDVIFRSTVPVHLQGRVYACRNTLQFFTIPIGLFLGGFMVDSIFEPFMAGHGYMDTLTLLFGSGKGSGAAVSMFVLGLAGTIHCLVWGHKMKQYPYSDKE